MQWTREQRRAIEARGTNILLSAAAGSGKTTVLVEHVLELIREGADVDRMLIVTFTRTASSDMRAKLSRELGARAAEGDERCREQQLLLDRASISTLHGFCADFLRAHFESAGVDPAFRVLDDAEVRRLADESLDEAIEEAYEAGGAELIALDYARGPKRVREMAELLIRYLDERPDPEAWLERACAPDDAMRAAWIDELTIAARREIERAMVLTRMALNHPDCNGNYAPALEQDLRTLARIRKLSDFDALRRALSDFRQASPGRKKSEPPIGKEVAQLRKDARATLDGISLLKLDLGVALSDVRALEPEYRALRDIALRARALFASRKAELAGLSYADLEHRTLRALEDDAVAAELRERFEHIFVDEYQDTSDVQEAIIARIARGNNLFMVGDVKQSIYRFRQAEPRLFLEKYERYGRGEGGQMLPLTMNFRSRPAILNFVNRIFEHALGGAQADSDPSPAAEPIPASEPSPAAEPAPTNEPIPTVEPAPTNEPIPAVKPAPTNEPIPTTTSTPTGASTRSSRRAGTGEIVYDAAARLNHGNAELTGGSVELHLLRAPDETADEALLEMAVCEREAAFIAGRIRALMAEDPTLRYRDFAILTRAKRGVLGKMATVLLQQGIPAFADGSQAFYDSMEVLLALSLLKLTANRRSDVELIGVLRSPVVGVTLNELAHIRAAFPQMPFVDAATSWADGTDELAWKLRDFFLLLERWQLLALCTDLGQLTRMVLDESGLYDCVGALPGGPQRQANLNRLADSAAAFDRDISGSLTRFLKHTEKLRAQGDGDEAHLLGEGDDVVRLMTAHKSKGLEFPVVFGAMLGRKYSNRAGSAALSAQRELGLGCLYCDPKLQSRRKTLPQMAIAERERREDRAEELRVLYVLLTRARDRLVLVGSERDMDAAWLRWEALWETPGAADNYLSVILSAIGREGAGLCAVSVHPSAAAPAVETVAVAPTEPAPDPELLRALLWRYERSEEALRPLKLTVTGLLREIQSPSELEPLIERPSFLTEEALHVSGAERGSAYHRAMQLLDLAALRALKGRSLREAISAQLDGFVSAGRMPAPQRSAVRDIFVARFLEGEIGKRLLDSRDVRREWPFNARMRLTEALSPEEAAGFGDGEIMVQGAIDCCFLERGGWVLLDYKTDRSDEAEALTLRYRNQLRLYAAALERVTKLPVREIWLCLLCSNEALPISRVPGIESADSW